AEPTEELNKSINGAPGPSEALKDLASEEAVSRRLEPSPLEMAPPSAAAETKSEDWYLAIDEKQVGPLNLEKLKAFWDGGQIGPDALCWRAGFSDWTALSGIQELSSLLAPRPAAPVIIAAPTAQPSVPAAPVESVLTGSFAPKTSAATPTAPAPQEEGTG